MLRPGARVTRFEIGGEELAVLSFPINNPKLPASITPAEREIIRWLLKGMSNAEIARRRGTSARTVANQIASIFRKFGVSSRSELVSRLSS
jgi:DNA-binding CsgD family transcriptional regulator